ncbi:MAG: ExsB family transcriptional regulator, partial [Deltaproteobacteria bacterium RBG_19FT_COMBO_43_11]
MKIKEIKAKNLNTKKFIEEKVREIRQAVGDGLAINALSGGVDSSVVTALGHKALGNRLKTYFIDNGIMREGEPQRVVSAFRKMRIHVEIIDASQDFFDALKGITDPEEKREAITQTFYKKIFANLVIQSNAKYLLQGTILTDVDETVAGIKRQHNVFEQLGIDPQTAFGYKILEPLIQLRKDGVRKAGRGLGLPEAMFNRIPFPGPALAARVIGEVTPEKIAMVKKATAITETTLKNIKAFQYMAILHDDRVTGMRNNKRVFGNQIEIRCWNSLDARTAKPTRLSFDLLEKIAAKIT